jgi:paraquat-inducible protein A
MQSDYLMACHECDLLHRIDGLPEGATSTCSRCGAVLVSHKRNSLDRSLALTLTGLILFVIANAYPILEIKSGSLYQATTIFGSVEVLFAGGTWEIGLLVFFTAIFFPFLDLVSRLTILIPLKMNKTPWKTSSILTFMQSINPWGMMDVFMLGILVSVVKLVKMMKVIPGISLFAFVMLIFVLAGIAAAFDTHLAWERVEGES